MSSEGPGNVDQGGWGGGGGGDEIFLHQVRRILDESSAAKRLDTQAAGHAAWYKNQFCKFLNSKVEMQAIAVNISITIS